MRERFSKRFPFPSKSFEDTWEGKCSMICEGNFQEGNIHGGTAVVQHGNWRILVL